MPEQPPPPRSIKSDDEKPSESDRIRQQSEADKAKQDDKKQK